MDNRSIEICRARTGAGMNDPDVQDLLGESVVAARRGTLRNVSFQSISPATEDRWACKPSATTTEVVSKLSDTSRAPDKTAER